MKEQNQTNQEKQTREKKLARILGYGEDALTLRALREHLFEILNKFQEKTPQSKCLVFYRPSFGRRNKANSSVFGEFDAIIASKRNIYLVESKWDNLADFKNNTLILRKEQILRHEILSWYLTHWNEKYTDNWTNFLEDYGNDFKEKFKEHHKTVPTAESLLAKNLEFILTESQKQCKEICADNIKNVLLFFFSSKIKPPIKTDKSFTIITINYAKWLTGNFIGLTT